MAAAGPWRQSNFGWEALFARMAVLQHSSRRTAAGRLDQKENVLPRVTTARPAQLAVLVQSV
jgi:hypothetical protein